MHSSRLQTVLYVDDEPDICAVVKATLSVIGHLTVHIAPSGSRALEIVNEVDPDLVLMDVMMPGLDGPSTLIRLRATAQSSRIPVIFMTAKVLPAEVAHFLHLGALGVIRKPFNPLTLCNELFAIWNSAHGTDSHNPAPGDPRNALSEASSLSVAFLQRTARDIVILQRSMENARPGDRSAYREIERMAHSINGAGAMFGFSALSTAAAEVEQLARGAAASCELSPPIGAIALFGQLRGRVSNLADRACEAGCIMPDAGGVFQS